MSGARIVTFSVSGNIDVGQYRLSLRTLVIHSTIDNLTIDGSTAPNQGVRIRAALSVFDATTHHSLYAVPCGRPGYDLDRQPAPGCASNAVVDHCYRISGGDDGDLDIVGDSHNITVQWCILAPGTLAQVQPLMNRRMIASLCTTTCFIRITATEHPEADGGPLNCDWVNNVIYRNRPASQSLPVTTTALSLWPPTFGIVDNQRGPKLLCRRSERECYDEWTSGFVRQPCIQFKFFRMGQRKSGSRLSGRDDNPQHVY